MGGPRRPAMTTGRRGVHLQQAGMMSWSATTVMTRTLKERSDLSGGIENDRRSEQAGFLSAYPGYLRTALLDRLRATEYSYLDAGGQVYLDYTGAGLPAQAQLDAHAEWMRGRCFGNPHSESRASVASTELIERARLAVLWT